MTLPKKGTRPLEHNGENYRWMLGKHRAAPDDSMVADIIVETPDGKILKREMVIAVSAKAYTRREHRSITTQDAINVIDDQAS